MTSDEVKAEYQKAIDQFKMLSTFTFDNTKGALAELEKSANANFDGITQAYQKGFGDMKAQVMKGNQAMLEKFQSNFQQIQKALDDCFSHLQGENITMFGSNVSKFSENIGNLISKIPGLKDSKVAKGAEEVGKFCADKQKETLDAAQARLNQVKKILQENWEDSNKKLTVKEEDLSAKKVAKK